MKYIPHILIGVVASLFVVGSVYLQLQESEKQAPVREAKESLAQCLADSGAIFYGAFWCPACAEQKARFGKAAKQIPYEECSMPERDPETNQYMQFQQCVDVEIRNYPTWQFTNGMRCTGVVPDIVLAHMAGCTIPVDPELSARSSAFERLFGTFIQMQQRSGPLPVEELDKQLSQLRDRVEEFALSTYNISVDELTESQVADILAQQVAGCAPYPPTTEPETQAIEG